jgi:chitodextrinase
VTTLTGTSATVSGLAASTTYRFTVTARDAAGNTSPASNEVTATTSGGGGQEQLLSRGRPATASSTETPDFTADKAVDGNTSTRWSSQFSDPQWIAVDLGSTATITRVKLNWEAAYGRAYRVETSNDGNSWTQIYATTSSDGGVDEFTVSGSGRHVRVYGTQRGTQWGYSLWEFEVYGTGGGGGGDTQPPTAPGNLRSTGTTSSSASLAWNASTDNVGVTGYDVQQDGSTVTTVSGTSTTVSGLAASTTYQFRVRARDAAGNTSGFSNTISVTTQGGGGGGGVMAAAPYLYAWGEPPAPGTVMSATGVKWFTIAFVLSDGSCNPAWDGTGPITGGWHASTISAIRAAGGDVIPSFGGWAGNKLGERCGDPTSLANAYMRVVDAFNLNAIDIDIEATEFENEAVQDRVLNALKIVKQRKPGIKTIVTFGTGQDGPTWWGQRLVRRGAELGANVDVWTIMPFDFGGGGADMGQLTIRAAEGLKSYVQSTHGYSDAAAYQHSGISGMNGLSDQREVSTVDDFREMLAYANQHHIGRFTFWSVNRDRPCDGQVAGNCSGLPNHSAWDYTRVVAQYRG